MVEHRIADDLAEELGSSDPAWFEPFVAAGLQALEQRLAAEAAMDKCDRLAGR